MSNQHPEDTERSLEQKVQSLDQWATPNRSSRDWVIFDRTAPLNVCFKAEETREAVWYLLNITSLSAC